ncbi:MAG: hypothetical protein CFE31_19380 [Rhizobiales bacterium PAR1]|nr:MAG: hypothetical protein CFE31_19380 [Rhizobiales bacterium PAR1]
MSELMAEVDAVGLERSVEPGALDADPYATSSARSDVMPLMLNKAVRAKIQEMHAEVERSISLQESAVSRIRAVCAERDQLTSTLEHHQQQVALLNAEREALSSQCEHLAAVCQDMSVELKKFQNDVMHCEASKQKLETDIAIARAEARDLCNQLDIVTSSPDWRFVRKLRGLRYAVTRYSDLLTGRFQNPLFDADWYARAYPDVGLANVNPYKHYVKHGQFEGRQPNAYFDPSWYRMQNPDVAASPIDPLDHYLKFGGREGRRPHPLFPLESMNEGLSSENQKNGKKTPLEIYLSQIREVSTKI